MGRDEVKMFNNLLIVDSLRGHHSTGVATAGIGDHEVTVLKKAVGPLDFMQLKGYEPVVNPSRQVLMGHNRYATVGKVNNLTAHPFEFDKVVGMHNGTLQGWNSLKDAPQFTVDSECLLHNINERGFKATIPEVDGAYALTVFNKETRVLSFLRNDKRTLYIATNKRNDVLMWASELWMLEGMAYRNEVELQKPELLPIDTLVEFELPKAKVSKIPKPSASKLEGKKFVYPNPVIGRNYQTTKNTNSTVTGNSWVGLCAIEYVTPGEGKGAPYLLCYETSGAHAEVRIEGLTAPAAERALEEQELQVQANGANWVNNYRLIHGNGKVIRSNRTGITLKAMLRETRRLNRMAKQKEEGNVVRLPKMHGPDGSQVTVRAFNALTKHGCGLCSCDIDSQTDFEWVGTDPVCRECLDELDNNGGNV